MVRTAFLFTVWVLAGVAAAGQTVDFSQAQKLSAQINSEGEDLMPLLSPDGKTLFFTRFMYAGNKGGVYSGHDIWSASWENGRWDKAQNSLLNNKDNTAVVGISADGKTLYLLSTAPSKKLQGVYFSKRQGGLWSAPELIPLGGLESEGPAGFYVSPDFEVIFISMKGKDSRGEEDLYYSVRNPAGEWSRARNLGTSINTTGYELSPFLSSDKKRLYFSSNGHPGGFGDADVYVSERLYNSWETWSVPRNLGSRVNSKGFDAYFAMYDTAAYFSSNRDSKFTDIYRVSVRNSVDSAGEAVSKIVAQAKSLLTDLGSKTPADSSANVFESVFITFDYNSADIGNRAQKQLDRVRDELKKKPTSKMVLVANSTDFDSEPLNNDLSYKRMEALKGYFDQVGLRGLKVSFELKKNDKKASAGKNGVEVRYSR
jgi:outer membrane protein OmpA-like peptidoglycan-associated protein